MKPINRKFEDNRMKNNVILKMIAIALLGLGSANSQTPTSDEVNKLSSEALINRIVVDSTVLQRDKMIGKNFETTFEIEDVMDQGEKRPFRIISKIPKSVNCFLEFGIYQNDEKLKTKCESLNKGESITVRGKFQDLKLEIGYLDDSLKGRDLKTLDQDMTRKYKFKACFELTEIIKVEKKDAPRNRNESGF